MIFIDINTQFGQQVSSVLLTDMAAIQNKMLNLCRCPIGSRFRQPEFGTNLNKFVHQPVDSITTHDILTDVLGAISRWMINEVTVDMQASYVIPRPTKDGYYVKIAFSVPRLRQAGSLSFSAMRD